MFQINEIRVKLYFIVGIYLELNLSSVYVYMSWNLYSHHAYLMVFIIMLYFG